MIIPWRQDEERRLTDAQMIEQLMAEGYDQEGAQYVVDVIRGRVDDPDTD